MIFLSSDLIEMWSSQDTAFKLISDQTSYWWESSWLFSGTSLSHAVCNKKMHGFCHRLKCFQDTKSRSKTHEKQIKFRQRGLYFKIISFSLTLSMKLETLLKVFLVLIILGVVILVMDTFVELKNYQIFFKNKNIFYCFLKKEHNQKKQSILMPYGKSFCK